MQHQLPLLLKMHDLQIYKDQHKLPPLLLLLLLGLCCSQHPLACNCWQLDVAAVCLRSQQLNTHWLFQPWRLLWWWW